MSRTGPLSDGSVIKDLYLFTQLCQFLKAGGKRSFSRAAAQLQVSQTRLQDCLARLEKEYGATLIETYARSADSKITEAGEAVLARAKDLPGLLDRIRDEVARISSGNGEQVNQVRVGASPFLLAQVFPAAVSGFLAGQPRPDSIRIECEEVYDSDKLVEKVGKDLDFAVVWDYPEKRDKIEKTPRLTCARASRRLDAVLIFGSNHERWWDWLKPGAPPWIDIEDLEGVTLFSLAPEHQPLYDLLPPSLRRPSKTPGPRTFSSIISSIRAGMPVAAIVAGIYKELDRYRRDGSLFFLPLRSRRTRQRLSIDMLYVYEGTRPPSFKEDKIPDLSRPSLNKLTPTSEAFLRYIDSTVLPGLLHQSGWLHSAPDAARDAERLLRAVEQIEEFTHAYHVSAPEIGRDRPRWYPSRVALKKLPGNKPTHPCRGEQHTRKSPQDIERAYDLDGELVGRQVFCLKGHLREPSAGPTDRDSFVAILNHVGATGDYLIGIWSGRDDVNASAMSGTFILSKKDSFPRPLEIEHDLQAALVRNLFRTDARPIGAKSMMNQSVGRKPSPGSRKKALSSGGQE
jgi:DNA-binding transcriptional LysR family regulator